MLAKILKSDISGSVAVCTPECAPLGKSAGLLVYMLKLHRFLLP